MEEHLPSMCEAWVPERASQFSTTQTISSLSASPSLRLLLQALCLLWAQALISLPNATQVPVTHLTAFQNPIASCRDASLDSTKGVTSAVG